MPTTTDSISVAAARESTLPELKPGLVVAGRFEVLARAGDGMIGAVYKVKSVKSGEIFGLKLISPRQLKSGMNADAFAQEIRLISRLKHPGIVQYLESGEHDGLLFCTMEWVDGRSMRDWLTEFKAKNEDPPGREVQEILVQVLEALAFAHAANPPAVHEALKPENVLITSERGPDGKPRRRVKVSDFFVGRCVHSSVYEQELNRTGAPYLAPEVTGLGTRGQPVADTYSVGAMLYEALTGQPPAGTWQPPSELRPKELTEAVDRFIELALAPDAQDRFQTPQDMLNDMKAMTSGLSGQMDPRMRLIAGVLAVVVVVAMVAGFVYLTSLPSPEELEKAETDRWAALRAELKAQPQAAAPAPEAKHAGMTFIPAGKYVRGQWAKYDEGNPNERPEAVVDVPGFWIDTEEAHTPRDPANPESMKPLRNMQHSEAEAYCDGLGKRLCTEDEWEKACKGPDNSIYAYGDEFMTQLCPPSGWKLRAYEVTEFPRCLSGYGVHDLGGGLLEWTSGREGANNVVKGGAVGNELKGTRCAARSELPPATEQAHIGLRCCAS
jgi:hypothetical protein